MEFEMNLRQPVYRTAGVFEPARLWALRPVRDDDASDAGTRKRPYSFWAECECPSDCLRDHENE